MRRDCIVKLRVSAEEKARMEDRALACGCSLSDCIRLRVLECRLRQTPEEKERLRLLARAGNNLNQLARWANVHKERMETVEIILRLELLWQALRESPPQDGSGPCT